MSWARMRFRDEIVFVRVDGAGKPVLDSEGRAEMKYRETDARSYRPAPVNLTAAGPQVDVVVDVDVDVAGPSRNRPAGRSSTRASTSASALPATPSRRSKPNTPAAAPYPASANTVHVWTDGACSGNPGPMGIGVVVLHGDQRREHAEYLGVGTNNIAELTAIARGLQLAEPFIVEGNPVRVYTDSAYSIGLLSQGWKAKANQQLVAELRQQLAGLPPIVFVKVAGHAGIPENERCDELARQAVERRR